MGGDVASSGDTGDGTMMIVSPGTVGPFSRSASRSKVKYALSGSSWPTVTVKSKYPLSVNSREDVVVGNGLVGGVPVGGAVMGSAVVGGAVIGIGAVGVLVGGRVGASVGGAGRVFSLQAHCISPKVFVVSQINHS
jgi:hypothetical protein